MNKETFCTSHCDRWFNVFSHTKSTLLMYSWSYIDGDDVYYQNEWVVSEPADQTEPADRSESADLSGQMCRCING